MWYKPQILIDIENVRPLKAMMFVFLGAVLLAAVGMAICAGVYFKRGMFI